MGTNTALITRKVIENAYQVLAIQYMALAQATDCLKIADKLAPATRQAYDAVRSIMPARVEDAPFYDEIAQIEKMIKNFSIKPVPAQK